eukprot:301652-Chlamydomonas_euryale.AAC.2
MPGGAHARCQRCAEALAVSVCACVLASSVSFLTACVVYARAGEVLPGMSAFLAKACIVRFPALQAQPRNDAALRAWCVSVLLNTFNP